MKQILNHAIWNTHALLAARVLMGGFFLLAGIMKLQGIDGVAGYISSVGLPIPLVLAWASALFEVGAGIAIITGKYFKEATLLLAAFVIVVSFLFHSPSTWGDAMQQMMFMKNMAIVAGLLFMAAHGAGNTWKLKV